MAASNALESRIFASSVFRFTRMNQVLELGVDDMENEEQKRLTKSAAWKSNRAHDDGDQGSLGGVAGLKHCGAGPAGGRTCSLSTHLRGRSTDMFQMYV